MGRDNMPFSVRVLRRLEAAVQPMRGVVPFNRILFASVFVLGGLAFWLAYDIRFEFDVPQAMADERLSLALLVASGKLIIFYLLKGHTISWRYVGVKDIPTFIVHAVASSLMIVVLSMLVVGWRIPRGVIVIDFFLTMLFIGGSRLLLRMAREETRRLSKVPQAAPKKRAIVIGAGEAGEMVVRELMRSHNAATTPIALFDDNRGKIGVRIHGVPVVGVVADVPAFVQSTSVDVAIVAIPSATRAQFNRIYDILKTLDIQTKTLPAFSELIDGISPVQQLRDIDITDLLGRSEIKINTGQVKAFIAGKAVLITGAGGSIGAELCRQVLQRSPARLAIIDRSENGLFHIHRDLLDRAEKDAIEPVLLDVTDKERTMRFFQQFKPDIVFHAAAHKHVPIQERDPVECFRNNVGGSISVASAAHLVGTKNFIMISTDKAVNPTSVMGATKRVCEMYCQAMGATSHTNFVCVRFGNVLASEGSVVPIFMQQIAKGGPVTVTHPDMKRYFMTIPEAVTLVLQASVLGKSGQVLLLDMGSPIRIVDLVHRLIEVSGKRPEDIPIQFIGMRPGEKLFEELLCTQETCIHTAHEKVKVCRLNSNGDSDGAVHRIEACLHDIVSTGDPAFARACLKTLVPEYAYNGDKSG